MRESGNRRKSTRHRIPYQEQPYIRDARRRQTETQTSVVKHSFRQFAESRLLPSEKFIRKLLLTRYKELKQKQLAVYVWPPSLEYLKLTKMIALLLPPTSLKGGSHGCQSNSPPRKGIKHTYYLPSTSQAAARVLHFKCTRVWHHKQKTIVRYLNICRVVVSFRLVQPIRSLFTRRQCWLYSRYLLCIKRDELKQSVPQYCVIGWRVIFVSYIQQTEGRSETAFLCTVYLLYSSTSQASGDAAERFPLINILRL